jgi:hypothetical protein
MATEVWFRNPDNYIRELIEVGVGNLAWDRGYCVKRGINVVEHAKIYFATNNIEYRILNVGKQGSAEYRAGDPIDKPHAVYPTWGYGEDSILLEELLTDPLGEDVEACTDMDIPPDERPVWGQEHRVVITDLPNITTGPGRSFLRYLKVLQEDHPEAIIHLHGTYSWKAAFGMGFGAADVEPRAAAAKGKVHTPSGRTEKYERMTQNPQWAAAMGFTPAELAVPRNRCIYNIKSALWAGKNYSELYKFKTRGEGSGDYTSSDSDHVPATTKSHLSRQQKAEDGDKFICDSCSLQNACKYYRSGAVCTVPGAEPVRLAKMFNSRDADDILDGLARVQAATAARMERHLQLENDIGDLDPEVTKMMGQTFDQGVKLAKLLDPKRFAPGAKVAVNVGNGGAAAIQVGGERGIVAQIVQQLVQDGIPRDQITSEMIQGVIEGMQNPDRTQKAIQGTVISSKDE